jgi:hypothetical protein
MHRHEQQQLATVMILAGGGPSMCSIVVMKPFLFFWDYEVVWVVDIRVIDSNDICMILV